MSSIGWKTIIAEDKKEQCQMDAALLFWIIYGHQRWFYHNYRFLERLLCLPFLEAYLNLSASLLIFSYGIYRKSLPENMWQE